MSERLLKAPLVLLVVPRPDCVSKRGVHICISGGRSCPTGQRGVHVLEMGVLSSLGLYSPSFPAILQLSTLTSRVSTLNTEYILLVTVVSYPVLNFWVLASRYGRPSYCARPPRIYAGIACRCSPGCARQRCRERVHFGGTANSSCNALIGHHPPPRFVSVPVRRRPQRKGLPEAAQLVQQRLLLATARSTRRQRISLPATSQQGGCPQQRRPRCVNAHRLVKPTACRGPATRCFLQLPPAPHAVQAPKAGLKPRGADTPVDAVPDGAVAVRASVATASVDPARVAAPVAPPFCRMRLSL